MGSAPSHPAPDSHLQDRQVRRVVSRAILGVLVLLVLGAHLLEQGYAYDLNRIDPNTGAIQTGKVRHGSYGFYLARVHPRPGQAKPIILLSNSAYRGCGIVERMQAMAQAQGRKLEFFNLAQAGAGIHDHQVQLARIIDQRPALVVVAFINLAFTSDGRRRNSLPRFRTDSDQMAFEPSVISVLPASFYLRNFSLEQAAGSILSSVFPYKRLDTILRWEMGRALRKRGLLPPFARALFSFPSLNLAANWQRRRINPTPPTIKARPYPDTPAVLREIIDMAKSRGIPILFIRQESGPKYDHPEIMPELAAACATYDRAYIIDLKQHWKQADIPDHVHPRGNQAREAYARRHYQAIIQTLDRLP